MPEFVARNFFLEVQQERNRATRQHWQLFTEHRQRVTELLIAAAPSAASSGELPARLCVLGAGNCNDLELPRLMRHFGHIHLVDWDTEALAQGIARQGLVPSAGLVCHGGIDLAGVGNLAHPSLRGPLSDDEFSKLIEKIQSTTLPPLGEPVEVVASVCLLSQLLEGVIRSFKSGDRMLLEAIQTLRLRHLNMLVELLVPGGTGLLVSDVVSSDTLPQLLTCQEFELKSIVADAIARQNFFTGLNPGVLLQLLSTDPHLSSLIEEIYPISPWRWNLGSRVYGVFGIRFRRRPA